METGLFTPLQRPKVMHWTTYRRLLDEHDAAEREFLGRAVGWIERRSAVSQS